MKQDWPKVRLRDVVTVERETIDPPAIRSGTRYVGLEHIDGENGRVQGVNVDAGDLASMKFAFTPRHVLYGKLRPYLRKVARPEVDGICSTDILPICPGNRIDRDYLFHFLRQPRIVDLATARCAGANLPRLSPHSLLEFPVPLPPLPEQKRIAAILDKADAIRRKRQESIRLADEFLRSAFLDMFGDPVTNPKKWRTCVLSDIADIASGVTKGRKLDGCKTVTVPYMRVANVQDGEIRLDDVANITVQSEDVTHYALQPGDILLTEGGDPDKLGRGAVWQGQVSPCIHQNHIFRVRVSATAGTPEFVSAMLGSALGKRYFFRCAKQTTGIASINMKQLKQCPILVPPMAQQQAYVTLRQQVRATVSRFEAAREDADMLFQSLSHRAFAGDAP